MMEGAVLCLLLLTSLTGTYGQTPCTLIMPNVLHVEAEETIVIDAQLQTEPFQAEISIQDFPQKTLEVARNKVTLNSANGFLEKVTIKIPAEPFTRDPKKKQYVSVSVKSDRCNLNKVALLSFQSGYIFIQTDKPIYNPGTTVLYRLFITGLALEPDTRTVDLEFTNPDGIVVLKNQFSSSDKNVIVQKSYTLPEIANEGKWQIACKFQVAPQQVFRTEFEVKEYVLPSFEVFLKTPEDYYYVDDDHFTVDIIAKFLHGKPVEGSGKAMFGVIVNNEKKSFPHSLTDITVTNGMAQATLYRHMITSRYRDPEVLLGSSLYVTVTVLTNAGSDLVEAEKTGITVTKTAFKVLFTKTSKYYKPGLPYVANLLLQKADGSAAPSVEICTVDNTCANSDEDGKTIIVLNTDPNSQEMQIHVRTKAAGIPDRRQTSAMLTVKAYKPQKGSQNYLHIGGIISTKVKPGDNLQIQFSVQTKNKNIQRTFSYITYMILSKGQVVEMGRQQRDPEQTLTVMSLLVSEKYMPSFRIVAYYIVPGIEKEIVSDSVLVDMVNSCIRKLEFAPDKAVLDPQPGSVVPMKIIGEPGANVGLVAVDKAVFVLNKKNRMSQEKVWEEVDKSDLGCTPGGGMDNVGVFTDAGLSVESNLGLTNPTRIELSCEESRRRRRRSVLSGPKAEKASEYKDARLRKCCEDGMLENPMGYSCQKRSEFVLEVGECARIFLECCKFVFEPQVAVKRQRNKYNQMSVVHFSKVVDSSASVKDNDNGDYEQMDNFNSRSIFYESWLWKVEILPTRADSSGFSSKVVNANLPESITTWEFLAVSISPKSGICVAKPYELLVKKSFFIDLRLPYSVVRNEQVEIRAVLYSYVPEDIEVRLDLTYNEKMCSAATADSNFRQVVHITSMGTLVVPFIIVPLETGNIRIEVKASVKDIFLTDGVVKHLKVVPEGMRILRNIQSVILEPSRSEVPGIQVLTIDAYPPTDIVPNTEPETYVSVKGGLLGETIENSIDGTKLKHLITVPSGCGEQNMMSMTPTVIATQYLDITNQWEKIGVDQREEAIKNINLGYVQQLVYRKADNSYSAFTNRPASTWLTAYVVKVFSMAYKLVYIEKEVLCGAVHWLLTQKQLPNGVFKEDAPVIHGEMVGGHGNTEPDASLTAFVLIALVEAKSFCKDKVPDLESGVTKSAEYLEGRLKTIKKPYSICIMSYALSLVDKLPNTNELMRSSTDGNHWDDYSSDLYMIEATSYALLALLKLKQYSLAEAVARWLTEQRFYGGGYGSTQATIMVFQAMSEYQILVPDMNEVDMDVTLALPGRDAGITWKINTANAMLQRSEKTKLKDKIEVTAKGKGLGTLTVMSVYYAPLAEGTVPCKNFDFSVKLEDVPAAKKSGDNINSTFINICMRYLGASDSTMTIVDLTLLTGYTADIDDLNRLTNKVDKYISKYEMDTERSERGSLILYLDKVSRSETECLKFKIHQNFQVGVLQPATVTIYEYYALENRCTKFYHPTEEEGELRKICKDAECHCISENCNLKNVYKEKLNSKQRVDRACHHKVDYVYECKLENIETTGAYDVLTMVITRVVKLGSDEVQDGAKRRFFIHKGCRDSVKVDVGRTYIIWGRSEDIWEMKKQMSYVINGDTWFETFPTEKECATTLKPECEEIYNFMDVLSLYGCQN